MTELLVTTNWLHQHLDDPNIRIVDIRGHVLPASEPKPHYFAHRDDYLVSHIPNAVFVDWVYDITDPDSPNAGHIAQPSAFAHLMGQLGIDEHTHVVAYDDFGGIFAARLWWGLNYYGHEKVSVLDGGWTKWLAEKRPVTADPPIVTPKRFHAKPNAAWRLTIEQVHEGIQNANLILVDVRTPDEYNGKTSRAKRFGHIPTALNLPRGDLIAPDNTMLPVEALRLKLAHIGITNDDQPVGIYCNAGVSASYGLLAMRVAGFKGGAVFDGSWKEWANDEDKPIVGT